MARLLRPIRANARGGGEGGNQKLRPKMVHRASSKTPKKSLDQKFTPQKSHASGLRNQGTTDSFYTLKLTQFKRATNISRTEALHTNCHDFIDRLPFVVTYNPSLPHISNILRKHFHILLSSKRRLQTYF